MQIEQVPCLTDNYSYILHQDGFALVIDPSEPDPVLKVLTQLSLHDLCIVNSHHHPDHIGGNQKIVEHYQKLWKKDIAVYCSQRDKDRIPCANHFWPLNDHPVELGPFEFEKIHSPGHTEGHFMLFQASQKLLFCADVLFSLGCGRLLEGTAQELFASLGKIIKLPKETLIYGAHEYTLDNLSFTEWSLGPSYAESQELVRSDIEKRLQLTGRSIPTSLEFEMAHNLFLSCRNVDVQAHLAQRMGLAEKPITAFEIFKILRQTRNLGPSPKDFVL